MQEHSHPFGPEEKYFETVRSMDAWIKGAGSRTMIYETWTQKTEPENQEQIQELFSEKRTVPLY